MCAPDIKSSAGLRVQGTTMQPAVPEFLQPRPSEPAAEFARRMQSYSRRMLKAARDVHAKWVATSLCKDLVKEKQIIVPFDASDGAVDEALLKYILKVTYQLALSELIKDPTAGARAAADDTAPCMQIWDTTLQLYTDAARKNVLQTAGVPKTNQFFVPYVASVMNLYTAMPSIAALLAPLLAAQRAAPRDMYSAYQDIQDGKYKYETQKKLLTNTRAKLARRREYLHYLDAPEGSRIVLFGPPLAKYAESFVKNHCVLYDPATRSAFGDGSSEYEELDDGRGLWPSVPLPATPLHGTDSTTRGEEETKEMAHGAATERRADTRLREMPPSVRRSDERAPIPIKIVIVGDSGVGKSCLLLRYVDNMYTESYISTIGVEFKQKYYTFEHTTYKIQLWDAAGQERFRTITSGFYSGSDAIALLYSLDAKDNESADNLPSWFDEVKRFASSGTPVVLGATKADLFTERSVNTLPESTTELASNKTDVIRTSAKENTNVKKFFDQVIRAAIINYWIKLDIASRDATPPTRSVSSHPSASTATSIAVAPSAALRGNSGALAVAPNGIAFSAAGNTPTGAGTPSPAPQTPLPLSSVAAVGNDTFSLISRTKDNEYPFPNGSRELDLTTSRDEFSTGDSFSLYKNNLILGVKTLKSDDGGWEEDYNGYTRFKFRPDYKLERHNTVQSYTLETEAGRLRITVLLKSSGGYNYQCKFYKTIQSQAIFETMIYDHITIEETLLRDCECFTISAQPGSVWFVAESGEKYEVTPRFTRLSQNEYYVPLLQTPYKSIKCVLFDDGTLLTFNVSFDARGWSYRAPVPVPAPAPTTDAGGPYSISIGEPALNGATDEIIYESPGQTSRNFVVYFIPSWKKQRVDEFWLRAYKDGHNLKINRVKTKPQSDATIITDTKAVVLKKQRYDAVTLTFDDGTDITIAPLTAARQ